MSATFDTAPRCPLDLSGDVQLIWVPLLLFVGHRLGGRVGDLAAAVRWAQNGGFWLAMLALTLVALWLVWGHEESKL